MSKCKYPNEVCANMTLLNGVAYCDSVLCSLKNEVPKQTNADRIRAMSDKDLAEFLMCPYETTGEPMYNMPCVKELGPELASQEYCNKCILNWLGKEIK